MSTALHAIAWVAFAGGIALVGGGLIAWWREDRFLANVLREIVPGGRFRDRDDLVRLKRRLSETIRWDEARMHERRPLLRASAAQVLASGEGFCGENARAAVRLLRLGGVDAHRLYLEGERWGHVVVEHEWEGGWRLFDGHVDPRTALPDEAVGRIDSADLTAFPNDARENPWRSSYRIAGLRRLPGMRAARPPAIVTALAESPALVVTASGAVLVLLGLVLFLRA